MLFLAQDASGSTKGGKGASQRSHPDLFVHGCQEMAREGGGGGEHSDIAESKDARGGGALIRLRHPRGVHQIEFIGPVTCAFVRDRDRVTRRVVARRLGGGPSFPILLLAPCVPLLVN